MLATRTKSGGTWPAPVYEAHFDNGKVYRMSFWTPHGKPFNVERARGLFGPFPPVRSYPYSRPVIDPAAKMIAGFIEHDVPGNPYLRFADPHFTGEAAPVPVAGNAKPKKSVKEARRLIRGLVYAAKNGGVNADLMATALAY